MDSARKRKSVQQRVRRKAQKLFDTVRSGSLSVEHMAACDTGENDTSNEQKSDERDDEHYMENVASATASFQKENIRASDRNRRIDETRNNHRPTIQNVDSSTDSVEKEWSNAWNSWIDINRNDGGNNDEFEPIPFSSSSGPANPLPAKRKVKPKIFTDNDDSSSDQDDASSTSAIPSVKDEGLEAFVDSNFAIVDISPKKESTTTSEEGSMTEDSPEPVPSTSTCTVPRVSIKTEDAESPVDHMTLPILANHVQRLIDIEEENFKIMNEMRETLRCVQDDVTKLTAALITRLPQEESRDVFHVERYTTVEEFEAFAERLEDKQFQQLVTKHFVAQFGQRDIGEVVRRILRATMTDEVQVNYNRTGIRPKRKLPQLLERCIYNTLRTFYKEEEEVMVKRGKEVMTTLRAETSKQIEVFLSNANTRINRRRN